MIVNLHKYYLPVDSSIKSAYHSTTVSNLCSIMIIAWLDYLSNLSLLYRNTISQHDQGVYPGDLALEEKITAILRWNALAMVMKANNNYGGVGGHIASYASCAEIFETGFNHFFKGGKDADLVFYQPHSSIYNLPALKKDGKLFYFQ